MLSAIQCRMYGNVSRHEMKFAGFELFGNEVCCISFYVIFHAYPSIINQYQHSTTSICSFAKWMWTKHTRTEPKRMKCVKCAVSYIPFEYNVLYCCTCRRPLLLCNKTKAPPWNVEKEWTIKITARQAPLIIIYSNVFYSLNKFSQLCRDRFVNLMQRRTFLYSIRFQSSFAGEKWLRNSGFAWPLQLIAFKLKKTDHQSTIASKIIRIWTWW